MWYKSENGDSIKPASVDNTGSKKWAYVRKNFKLIPASDDFSEHWEWDEQKLPKEMLDNYLQTQANIDYIAMMCDVPLEEV